MNIAFAGKYIAHKIYPIRVSEFFVGSFHNFSLFHTNDAFNFQPMERRFMCVRSSDTIILEYIAQYRHNYS